MQMNHGDFFDQCVLDPIVVIALILGFFTAIGLLACRILAPAFWHLYASICLWSSIAFLYVTCGFFVGQRLLLRLAEGDTLVSPHLWVYGWTALFFPGTAVWCMLHPLTCIRLLRRTRNRPQPISSGDARVWIHIGTAAHSVLYIPHMTTLDALAAVLGTDTPRGDMRVNGDLANYKRILLPEDRLLFKPSYIAKDEDMRCPPFV